MTIHGPINWQFLLNFYRKRAIRTIEQVDDCSYKRSFEFDNSYGFFKAYIKGEKLRVEFEISDISRLRTLISTVRRMFDLDTDIAQVENHLGTLSETFIALSGIRIPGVWNIWEAGVRAILGQQVSVSAAINLLNVLVENINTASDRRYCFPTEKDILASDLSFLKMPRSRKDTLRRFAEYYLQNPKADVSSWESIKGIGPWTVSYAKLRGESQPNCFVDTDLVVKKVLEQFPELNSDSVSPWGSYATLHCWSHQS